MSLITVEECRARGISLPADDAVAQDIVYEQEAWLSRRIGLLAGERTERFFVGPGWTFGKLGLRRFTDAVTLTDNGNTVNANHFLLVDHGSAVAPSYESGRWWWTGLYVEATYTPNDEDEVRRALFDLVAYAAPIPTPYASEQIGAYTYSRATGSLATPAARAAIASALLPRHDPNLTLSSARTAVNAGDPVINRAEPVEGVW